MSNLDANPDKPLVFNRFSASLFWSAFLLIFILELMAYTWLRVQNTSLGYAVTAASRQQQELQLRQTNLRLEISRLQSPERLARLAQRLELKTPTAEQIVILP